MKENSINFEKKGKVGIISLQNGDYNVFDKDQMIIFKDLIQEIKKNPKINTLVIKSSSNKAFSTGLDLKKLDQESIIVYQNVGIEAIKNLYHHPIPKIALINGHTIGYGCFITFACDFRYATKDTIFQVPEINIPYTYPIYGGISIISRILKNPSDAKYILCTGNKFEVEHASKMGLVDRIFDTKDEMIESGLTFAKELSLKDTHKMKMILASFDTCQTIPVKKGMKLEEEAFSILRHPTKELKKYVEEYIEQFNK
ncbi:MAG: enoyl-CoA hydratase/isomerase family protein [Candidatus Lokiarchaeota archaeon]|nr:enoyl-CoA hydratase/isomerase family protein [Candidatus Lokiarchaeota archaeon]